jgi:signal peptidase
VKRSRLIALIVAGLLVATAFTVVALGIVPYRVYVVHTGSMEPTIPSTSAVIVRVGSYKVGQPVSFVEQGDVITHRLVRVNADGTIDTKGDANATNDPWHPSTKAIIGGVVAAPLHLGYWLEFLKNPFGLLTVLLGAMVCWQVWALAGKVEKDARGSVPERSPSRRRAMIRHGHQGAHRLPPRNLVATDVTQGRPARDASAQSPRGPRVAVLGD